MREHPVTRA